MIAYDFRPLVVYNTSDFICCQALYVGFHKFFSEATMRSYEIYSEIRNRKGMRDSSVAATSGIAHSTFSDWKSGKSEPKTAKLIKIADALGVSLEELLGTQKEYFLDAETAAIAQEVHDRPELKAMFNQLRKASPDSIRLAAEVIEKIARPICYRITHVFPCFSAALSLNCHLKRKNPRPM